MGKILLSAILVVLAVYFIVSMAQLGAEIFIDEIDELFIMSEIK